MTFLALVDTPLSSESMDEETSSARDCPLRIMYLDLSRIGKVQTRRFSAIGSFPREYRIPICLTLIALGIISALGVAACLAGDRFATDVAMPTKVPSYAVRTSASNRYLVDQNNTPFMIVGDSPHTLIGKMSKSDAQFYMANRQQYGIN